MAADTIKSTSGRVTGTPGSSSRLVPQLGSVLSPRLLQTDCLFRPKETPEQRQQRKQAEKDRAQAQVGSLTAYSTGTFRIGQIATACRLMQKRNRVC